MTHLGFTGSSKGLTLAQTLALADYLKTRGREVRARHGGCVGGDATFHSLLLDLPARTIIVHPSTLTNLRAECPTRYPHDVVLEPKPPLARDQDIVDALAVDGGVLLAAPNTSTPVLRSGTWTTVRMAQKARVPVVFFLPNGAVIPYP